MILDKKKLKLSFKMSGDIISLFIYDEIYNGRDWEKGGINESSADIVRQTLEKNSDAKALNIYISSNGGDVFEAYKIISLIQRFKGYKTAYIDGLAASAASLIPLVCDKIIMAKYSTLMIHNAWTFAIGNSNELRQIADQMDKIMDGNRKLYMERFNESEDKLIELLNAETFLTAQECLSYGLCDQIINTVDKPKESEHDEGEEDKKDEVNKKKSINEIFKSAAKFL